MVPCWQNLLETYPLELTENSSFWVPRKIGLRRSFCWKHTAAKLPKECWVKLLAVADCNTLQEPGTGEATCLARAWLWRSCDRRGLWPLGKPQGLQDLAAGQVIIISGGPLQENTWGSGKETSSFNVSLVPSTDSFMCLLAKVKYVKGLAPFSQSGR